VINLGELPNHVLFRTITPILWVVFCFIVAYYVGAASRRNNLVVYDFTSLIPFAGFAVTDFIFAARLRKRRHPPEQAKQPFALLDTD
jgi:hypothetical protein